MLVSVSSKIHFLNGRVCFNIFKGVTIKGKNMLLFFSLKVTHMGIKIEVLTARIKIRQYVSLLKLPFDAMNIKCFKVHVVSGF